MSEMYRSYGKGTLEVISGCMFAGKTEELIRRIKVLEIAKQKVLVFKPRIDNRYSDTKVASHAGSMVDSIVIDHAAEILDHVTDDTDVVAIDEVQFLDRDIVEVCDILADRGIRVMAAGLDMDFRGEPFGVMPTLLTKAEFVTKLTAVCVKCGAPATRTQRIVNGRPAAWDDPQIVVGAQETYEARCRHCHEVTGRPYRLIRK
jgi:thymidine kinase